MGLMSVVTRLGRMLVCLVVLAAPAAGVCATMSGSMGACSMQGSHDMAGCADEIAPSTDCCDAGAVDIATDLILKRPDEATADAAETSQAAVPGSSDLSALSRSAQDWTPPPRPSPYRLHSALLL